MDALLQVRDLSVQYVSSGTACSRALCGISFEVSSGEAVGVLGESGSGKTTLALALVRLLPSAAQIVGGSILFQDRELLAFTDKEMESLRGAGISLVFQEPANALNPVLRVGTQVADVLAAHRDGPRGRRRETTEAALREVGLADGRRIRSAYPHQLSGGQRQRVVIAQALACHPALLIADEPTSSLDAVAQAEILALLKRLQNQLGLAMIFISHDPAILAEVTDRILIFYAGQVVEEGSTKDVLTEPLHPYTQALLRCRPHGHDGEPKMVAIPGEPPDPSSLPAGCAFATRCEEKMMPCAHRMPAEVYPAEAHRVRCFKYGG